MRMVSVVSSKEYINSIFMLHYSIISQSKLCHRENDRVLEFKGVEEFSCNVLFSRPAGGIHHRLAKIRHPSCNIFQDDSWDLKVKKHAKRCATGTAQGSSCLDLINNLQKTEMMRRDLESTQAWTLSPLRRHCDRSCSIPGMSRPGCLREDDRYVHDPRWSPLMRGWVIWQTSFPVRTDYSWLSVHRSDVCCAAWYFFHKVSNQHEISLRSADFRSLLTDSGYTSF